MRIIADESSLATTLSQDKKSIAGVDKSYAALETSLNALDLAEKPLLEDSSQTDLRRQSRLVRNTALAVLSCSDGKLSLDDDDETIQEYVKTFQKAVASSSSASDSTVEEPLSESFDARDGADSDEEIETTIVQTIFHQAYQCYQDQKYSQAERLFRDGFHHLRSLKRYPESLDFDEAHLRLSACCMHQDKWQEAELLLSLFLRDVDATSRIASEANHLLAETHLCLYDFEAALSHCRSALDARKQSKATNAYAQSLKLLVMIHAANGDHISARLYMSRLPQEQILPKYLTNKFSTYSDVPHLATSLAEKASAIEILMRSDRLTAITSNLSPSTSANQIKPLISMFNPGHTTLNISKTIQFVIQTKSALLSRYLLSLIPASELPRMASGFLIQSVDHSPTLALLLESGASITTTDSGERTALHWAANLGRLHVMSLLLDAVSAAEIDAFDKDQWTPLANAAGKGHEAVVKLLLAHGADPEKKTTSGQTPLHLAIRDNQPDTARCLIDAGSNTNAIDKYDNRPLHLATEWGKHDDVIHLLVKHQADVNALGHCGFTALRKLVVGGRLGTIHFLLQHGADPDLRGSTKIESCVWEACRSGRAEVLKLLLDFGANPVTEHNGRSALEIARQENHIECALLLEEKMGG